MHKNLWDETLGDTRQDALDGFKSNLIALESNIHLFLFFRDLIRLFDSQNVVGIKEKSSENVGYL